MKQTAVKQENIQITDGALMRLIKAYCRESGVRNLQKHVEKVRKAISYILKNLLTFHLNRFSVK